MPPRSSVYRAVADPTRRRLLDALREEEDQSLSSLCRDLSVSRQAVAKHLDILQAAGLVTVRTVGRERRHSLDARPLQDVASWVATYSTFWTKRLYALEHLIRQESDPADDAG